MRSRASADVPPRVPLLHAIYFVILATPRTKKNHGRVVQVRGRPLHLPSDAYLAFEARAVPQLRQQFAAAGMRAPVSAPVSVQARFYRDADRGDLVGYMQALADTLQTAGVLADDVWIRSWDGTRLDKDATRPRVELVVEPL